MKRNLVLRDKRYLDRHHQWLEGGKSMELVKKAARRMFHKSQTKKNYE